MNRQGMPSPAGKALALGEVKWFGGLNGQTGRVNDYGFISASNGDLYFHCTQSLSPPESLMPGVKVVFLESAGRKGKPAAESVRVLSLIPDPELVALLRDSEGIRPEDVLTIALYRDTLAPCENEVLQAVRALSATSSVPDILARFWEKFPPASPKDPLFPSAPEALKEKVCEQHYSEFRKLLFSLFSSVTGAVTSLEAKSLHRELDEKDEQIAVQWAGRDDYEALLAKMLSARVAERAAKKFYEGVGSTVGDISITQLEGGSGDWTTHDLLIDTSVAVDVKNARRPVNGKNFYVEHTVPKFKLDRRSSCVKIAGILSPYLNLKYIRNPDDAIFNVDDVVFLGETCRDSVDKLVFTFSSPTFEVSRAYERTIPNWVFGYPPMWYRVFADDVRRFIDHCEWPEGEEWEYVLDNGEKMAAIPVLCATGKPLPPAISSKLLGWQSDFYARMQRLSSGSPELPVVFLAVLTDFLEKLKGGQSGFSPRDYLPLLFAEDPVHTVSYPLGAIDPLGLVRALVKTLTILWDNRGKTKLENLSSFRFGGLGILQGREIDRREWKTIVAYCGGTVYQTDGEGNVILDPEGRPLAEKGKCGKSPLLIGVEANCPACGKLVCGKCGFCSKPCQERKFAERAEAKRKTSDEAKNCLVADFSRRYGAVSRWEEVPLEAYEDDFRRG